MVCICEEVAKSLDPVKDVQTNRYL